METTVQPTAWPRSIPLLWVEFLALYVAAPLAIALLIGAVSPINLMAGLIIGALFLLRRTPGFSYGELLKGPVLGEWRIILGFSLLAAVSLFALTLILLPERFLDMPLHRPALWLVILTFYPLFSALPQEVIFRTLFFRRYGSLFPRPGVAIAVNAAVFGLAHLFFGNPVTLILSVAGGVIFAWAYLRHGSTLLATVLHSIAGQLIFTSGMGIYFYHGAIPA